MSVAIDTNVLVRVLDQVTTAAAGSPKTTRRREHPVASCDRPSPAPAQRAASGTACFGNAFRTLPSIVTSFVPSVTASATNSQS